MNPLRRRLLAASSSLFAPRAFAQTTAKAAPAAWPRTASVPGGVARVPLGAGPAPPQAWLGDQRVLVLREGAGWVALVGIALLATGAVVGLLSGTSPLKRALRQLGIGYGAAAATYLLGLAFGATVS